MILPEAYRFICFDLSVNVPQLIRYIVLVPLFRGTRTYFSAYRIRPFTDLTRRRDNQRVSLNCTVLDEKILSVKIFHAVSVTKRFMDV